MSISNNPLRESRTKVPTSTPTPRTNRHPPPKQWLLYPQSSKPHTSTTSLPTPSLEPGMEVGIPPSRHSPPASIRSARVLRSAIPDFPTPPGSPPLRFLKVKKEGKVKEIQGEGDGEDEEEDEEEGTVYKTWNRIALDVSKRKKQEKYIETKSGVVSVRGYREWEGEEEVKIVTVQEIEEWEGRDQGQGQSREGTWERERGRLRERERQNSTWSAETESQISPRTSVAVGLQPRPQSGSRKGRGTPLSRGESSSMGPRRGESSGTRSSSVVDRQLTHVMLALAVKDTESDASGSVYSQDGTSVRTVTTTDMESSQDINIERLNAKQRAHTLTKLQENASPSVEDLIMLQQILEEQQKRYDEEIRMSLNELVPKPLLVKHKKPKRISIFKNARDSLEWGLQELTSPRGGKKKTSNYSNGNGNGNGSSSVNANVSVSASAYGSDTMLVKPRFSMHSGNTTPEEIAPSPPPKSARRRFKEFASGEHPLKSPYPFRGRNWDDGNERGCDQEDGNDGAGVSPSEAGLGKRISGVMRGFSTRKKSLPKNTLNTVPNKARKGSGPDTPIVAKSTFAETMHKGNGQLQGIFEKTKKSVMRSSSMKRRETLKKKITVVGIGDQSPGSYLDLHLRMRDHAD